MVLPNANSLKTTSDSGQESAGKQAVQARIQHVRASGY